MQEIRPWEEVEEEKRKRLEKALEGVERQEAFRDGAFKDKEEEKVESKKDEKVVIKPEEYELREYMETYPEDFTEK